MRKTESMVQHLRHMEVCALRDGWLYRCSVVGKGLFTLFLLILLLLLPLHRPEWIVPMLLVPLVLCGCARLSYLRMTVHSLFVVPLLLFFALFHPIPVMLSLLLRGVIALQLVYLLICTTGVSRLCGGLRRVGVARKMVQVLCLSHRYLITLLEEQIRMQHALAARGYGSSRYPVTLWMRLAGMLLLRTVDRSQRIHESMMVRGGEEADL